MFARSIHFYFYRLIFIFNFMYIIYSIELDEVIINTYYVCRRNVCRRIDSCVLILTEKIGFNHLLSISLNNLSLYRAIYTTYIMPLVTRAHVKFLKQLGHS